MYPEYIFKMLHIKRDFRGIFHFFLYNQPKTKNVSESLPLPILPFSPKLCTCIYIKNIMWNGGGGGGSWYKEGTMLQRQKKLKCESW